MADPFLGEIRLFAANVVPKGWLPCNGQLLPINQNQALYALLGTTYGSEGTTKFALPNLQGRAPVHVGNGVTQGKSAGEENHTLTTQEMPQHTHTVMADANTATAAPPANGYWAASNYALYDFEASQSLASGAISQTGGNQPHSNMQPYLVANFCIAVQGIFPSHD
ncbi:phage tail protein [Pseudaeromonas paramecii]|uniref:Tail fiber protein n=1 Tax=Pseudaeromonas paramecii TaxID=2138166 RepID=A0ABP8QKQ7_9GAMM